MVTGLIIVALGGLNERGGGFSGSKAIDIPMTQNLCADCCTYGLTLVPMLLGEYLRSFSPFHRHLIIGLPRRRWVHQTPFKVLKQAIRSSH